MAIFRGSFLSFEGSFFAFWGRNRPEPPCNLFPARNSPSATLLEPAMDSVSFCLSFSLVELWDVLGRSAGGSNHLDRDEKLTMISVGSRLSTTERMLGLRKILMLLMRFYVSSY